MEDVRTFQDDSELLILALPVRCLEEDPPTRVSKDGSVVSSNDGSTFEDLGREETISPLCVRGRDRLPESLFGEFDLLDSSVVG